MTEELKIICNEKENINSIDQDVKDKDNNITINIQSQEKQENEYINIIKEEKCEIKENIINENVIKEEDPKEISTEEISSEELNSDKEKNESENEEVEKIKSEENKNEEYTKMEKLNSMQQDDILNVYKAREEEQEDNENRDEELSKEKKSEDSNVENNIVEICENIKKEPKNEIDETQVLNKNEYESKEKENEEIDKNEDNSIIKNNENISIENSNSNSQTNIFFEEKIVNINKDETIKNESQKTEILDDKILENNSEITDTNLSNQKIIEKNEINQTKYMNKKNNDISKQNSSIKNKILQFEKNKTKGKQSPEKKPNIQNKLNKNNLDIFNNKTQESKEEKPKIIINRLDLNKYFPNKGKEKIEEKPKIISKLNDKRINVWENNKNEKKITPKKSPPKKLENNFIVKMSQIPQINEEKRNSFKEEIINSIDYKNILDIFTTKKNEDKKVEEKINPKKIYGDEYLFEMIKNHCQLKTNNNQEENKEIKKLNIEEIIFKMKEDELSRQAKLEIIKITPKKKFGDDYFKELIKSMNKLVIIRKKTPRKLNGKERLIKMKEDQRILNNNNLMINKNKDSFCDLNIEDRDINKFSTIVSNIEEREEENRKFEEEKKLIEEKKAKRLEEIQKRQKERKMREEEERKRRREELRIKREKEEEERKRKLEELRIKRQKEEEERKRLEEEEKHKLEEEIRKKYENMRKKEEEWKSEKEREEQEEQERKEKREEILRRYEEEKKRREEELRLMQEKRKKEEEERRKREEEELKERLRQYEERRRRLEEEERKLKEEKEKKIKEKFEKLKNEALKKMNKKEEDLTQKELDKLTQEINMKIEFDENGGADFYFEETDLEYDLEEINEISTDPIVNIEVINSEKLVVLTRKDFSKITIYDLKTYEVEKCIIFESKIDTLKIHKNKIYCALSELSDNILIISLDDMDNQIYLNGHTSFVTDLTYTSQGYLISADKDGNIKIWDNCQIKNSINDFNKRIDTITEISESKQRIAILSFSEKQVKFYDLSYTSLKPLATINDILGSGFQNNMLQLSQNIIAIAGTYLYIVDIDSFIVINKFNCTYANDCISTSLSLIDNKAYFFIGQAMTDNWKDDLEKGTIGYYEYEIKSEIYPESNILIKKASRSKCHNLFISSLRSIGDTIVTGAYDGKIKFWKLKDI